MCAMFDYVVNLWGTPIFVRSENEKNAVLCALIRMGVCKNLSKVKIVKPRKKNYDDRLCVTVISKEGKETKYMVALGA